MVSPGESFGRVEHVGRVEGDSANVISQYDYTYDAAGRRTEIARSGSAMSESRTDAYGYNDRNELTNAAKNATFNEYAYQYDDIGNRLSSLDLGTNRTYTANALNQYTNIVEGVGEFLPQFDDDGNQTLIKTATGLWQVSYNGENRPVLWECGSTNIIMSFDRMGRRVEYVETVSGVTNNHHRFVYDGYVCIQRLNAASNNAIDLVFGWDPSEPVATRPLIMQKYGEYNLFYTHDGNKNISELVFFQQANGIAAHYEYAPFGAVTATSRSTPVTAYDFREYNPFRFSAECADGALGLLYYNYRHYNPVDGRWTSRDELPHVSNLYRLLSNDGYNHIDVLGLEKDISFEDYLSDFIARIERRVGRKLTPEEKRWYRETLARGCIGIVSCHVGVDIDLLKKEQVHCYAKLENAQKKKGEMVRCKTCRDNESPIIYSIHLWDSKKGTAESEIKVDQNTGEVDMSNWQRKHRDGGDENCRFDYAYYDGCGNFFHADGIHNPDENNDGEGDIFKRKQIACMTVLKADLGEWQGSMRDAYNQEVWCVACGGWIVAGKNDPRIDHSKIKPVKPQN